MSDPIDVFKGLWRDARGTGLGQHRNAVCVSTVDADGYPSSRFVDLKEAEQSGFVFCTHLESCKALDIARSPKAGITLWWEHVATQVRIRGLCEPLADAEADAHWSTRRRDAQIATATFRQSRPLERPDTLQAQYDDAVVRHEGRVIARPADWGGFRLRPNHIEFLRFMENRLHARTAYAWVGGQWQQSFLQP